jgi:hypothetical protein
MAARVVRHWQDARYKEVVARKKTDTREDRAPRAEVDDLVYFNDFGPDTPKFRASVDTQIPQLIDSAKPAIS